MLLEQKDLFDYSVQILTLEISYLRVLDVVAIPLTFSFTMFMFSALIFAGGNIKSSTDEAEAYCDIAIDMFTVGFISIFVSLFFTALCKPVSSNNRGRNRPIYNWLLD